MFLQLFTWKYDCLVVLLLTSWQATSSCYLIAFKMLSIFARYHPPQATIQPQSINNPPSGLALRWLVLFLVFTAPLLGLYWKSKWKNNAGSVRPTWQAHWADVADLDEVAVTEAGRSVVNVDRWRKHQLWPLICIRQENPLRKALQSITRRSPAPPTQTELEIWCTSNTTLDTIWSFWPYCQDRLNVTQEWLTHQQILCQSSFLGNLEVQTTSYITSLSKK